MTEITHQKCPYVECGSSDAFSYNPDKKVGKCHSCGSSYPSKKEMFAWAKSEYPTQEFTPKRIHTAEEEEVLSSFQEHSQKGGKFVGNRGISSNTMEFYSVLNYGDREEYIYPSGAIKVRKFPKEFYAKNGFKGNELFGMNLFPAGCSKMVTLTEGEKDSLSAYQMLSGGNYLNPVVSLPSATPSGKLWENCKEWLDGFEKIILSADNDEPGRKVAETLFDLFPGKVYVMDHGQFKDANDFLQAGKAREFKQAWWAAKKYSPAGFTASVDDWMSAIDEEDPYEYTPTPISGYNEIGRGLVKGGITVVKAPPGTGKCLGPDVGVMLYTGNIKKAKDIVVGDVLMGDDGAPRNVLSTTTGTDEMFEVQPVKGEPWVCNSAHVLSLYHTGKNEVVDIELKNYLNKGSDFKHRAKQFRAPVEVFGGKREYPYMDPYAYGVFLGDGSKTRAEAYFGPKKKEVMDKFIRKAEDSGLKTKVRWHDDKNCWGVLIRTKDMKHGTNPYIKFDTSLVDFYKRENTWVRKEFLAGILDTDGYLTNNCYDLVQKDERVIDAVIFAARSLGLAAYKKEVTKGIKESGFVGTYYRCSISGPIDIIPTIRHKPKPRKQIKSVLLTGFSIKSLGKGRYYGFEVDGNSRFLLGDFTVTHNSSYLRMMMHDLIMKHGKTVACLMMEEMKSITGRAMATYELGINVKTKEDALNNFVSEDQVKEALRKVIGEEKFVSFDVNPQDPVEDTLKQCKHAIAIYGAEYIFIDHLQRLAYLSGTDGATAALTELGVKLTELAKRRNVGIICISHVNADNKTKYASSIEEEAIVLIEMTRDKKSEDLEERNTTYLEISKNRPYAITGPAGMLTYDVETDMVSERLGPKELMVETNNEEIPF